MFAKFLKKIFSLNGPHLCYWCRENEVVSDDICQECLDEFCERSRQIEEQAREKRIEELREALERTQIFKDLKEKHDNL